MEFLGVGIPEVIAIIMLALIFIGPRDLPRLAARFGKFVRDLRMMSEGFTLEWRRELEAATRFEDLKEIKEELKSTGQTLKEAGRDIRGSMQIDLNKLDEKEKEKSIRPPSTSQKAAETEKTVSRSAAKAQNGAVAEPTPVEDAAENASTSEASSNANGHEKVVDDIAAMTETTAVSEIIQPEASASNSSQETTPIEAIEPPPLAETPDELPAAQKSTDEPVESSSSAIGKAEVETEANISAEASTAATDAVPPAETSAPPQIEEPSSREQS